MNKLNGWRRLWLVAFVCFGIYTAYYFLLGDWPTAERIEASYQVNLESLKTASPSTDVKWWSDFYRLIRDNDIKDLQFKQAIYVVAPLVIWLGGSGVVYLLGWTIAWVRRGFRKPQV